MPRAGYTRMLLTDFDQPNWNGRVYENIEEKIREVKHRIDTLHVLYANRIHSFAKEERLSYIGKLY
jgi:hypothetical protein